MYGFSASLLFDGYILKKRTVSKSKRDRLPKIIRKQ